VFARVLVLGGRGEKRREEKRREEREERLSGEFGTLAEI